MTHLKGKILFAAFFAFLLIFPLFAYDYLDKSPAGHLENIARGKPYALSSPPNYFYCTEEGDKTDLTDGALSGVWTPGQTAGYWTEKTTVGWVRPRAAVKITIDLGKVEPIRGFAFRTIGGGAGVTWPGSVAVLVSEDGKDFYFAGDLVRLCRDDFPPAYPHGKPYWFWTDSIRTKGRYVSFAAVPSGIFLFTDEVEIYRGEDAFLRVGYAGAPVKDEDIVDRGRLTRLGAYRRMRRDLEQVRSLVEISGTGTRQKEGMRNVLLEISKELEKSNFPDGWESFRAIVPFNDLHRKIFAVYGRCLGLSGKRKIFFWQSPPYVMLPLFTVPDVGNEPVLTVKMMQNERRPVTFNITNASARSEKIRFALTGLPGGRNPSSVRIFQVEYVDTAEGVVVSSALVRLVPKSGYYESEVPAGMTRQIWLQVDSANLDAGIHKGSMEIRCGEMNRKVDFTVDVAAVRMPDRRSMACSLGAWDYVHNKGRGITDANKQAATGDIYNHVMNTVWATPASLPEINPKDFDEQGNLTGKIDFSEWDAFVMEWPDMKYYMVFAAFHEKTSFAGRQQGTAEFDNAVSQWTAAWATHNREILGLKPKQAGILWIDEPGDENWLRATYYYSRATKKGTDEITVFNDANASVVNVNFGKELLEMSDIVCPTRSNFLSLSQKDQEYYRSLPARGIQLHFYMCSGPARMFNAAYYRLQPWHAFDNGATGSHFWAYADTGGGNNWNEYWMVGTTNYAPAYFGTESVTDSKHWEAARAGILDYQYLKILRDRIEELEKAGIRNSDIAGAEKLSELAAALVIRQVQEKYGTYYESAPLSENVTGYAEDMRIQVLDMLKNLL